MISPTMKEMPGNSVSAHQPEGSYSVKILNPGGEDHNVFWSFGSTNAISFASRERRQNPSFKYAVFSDLTGECVWM